MLKGKRVAVLLGQKFEDAEAADPIQYLTDRQATVDVIGLDSGDITGKKGKVTLSPDLTIGEADYSQYDAVIIPGGSSPERVRLNDKALEFIKQFWSTGRPIATICHGPQVLISAGLVEGVALTCYIGIRDDVVNAGGSYLNSEVVIDGQLITSRNPDDIPAFNAAIEKALQTGFLDKEEQDIGALDALQIAASREKGAQEFYASVAEMIHATAVQNKFRYLSSIEEGHFDQLTDLYRKLSDGKEPKIDVKKNELGKHKVSPDITSDEAIQLAMDAEQKAYDFYRNATMKAKGAKIREMFEYLAAEELEHKRLLSVDRAAAHGGQGHFQWATHFDIPPGMDDMW